MTEDSTANGERRTRRVTKPLGATERKPLPGTRFPSVLFGENVRTIRQKLMMHQNGLLGLVIRDGLP